MLQVPSFSSLNRVGRELGSHVSRLGCIYTFSQKLCFYSLLKLLHQKPDSFTVSFLFSLCSTPSTQDGYSFLWILSWAFYPPNCNSYLSLWRTIPLQCPKWSLIWACIFIYQEEVARWVEFWMRGNLEQAESSSTRKSASRRSGLSLSHGFFQL